MDLLHQQPTTNNLLHQQTNQPITQTQYLQPVFYHDHHHPITNNQPKSTHNHITTTSTIKSKITTVSQTPNSITTSLFSLPLQTGRNRNWKERRPRVKPENKKKNRRKEKEKKLEKSSPHRAQPWAFLNFCVAAHTDTIRSAASPLPSPSLCRRRPSRQPKPSLLPRNERKKIDAEREKEEKLWGRK